MTCQCLSILYMYKVFEKTAANTKTYLYNFDPLKPHFYIVKLGFTGVDIIFLISAEKQRLWVLTICVLSRKMKNIRFFLSDFVFIFLVVKFSIYLNRRVFVMHARKGYLFPDRCAKRIFKSACAFTQSNQNLH